ncbi:RNA recognition motif containing protein [Plasmodiophora brassicae]|uniref:Uncharacterized protein n=1 Tax=Plasmodiophora brassicae TaxID=37360 RepID=A0A0G4IYY5_PLABS|nr:hypothetical protein PBRA_001531 [Plasmodiophora brassicae]SPQ94023.1 unnamed protein product [Plasmodiophora brassicae]
MADRLARIFGTEEDKVNCPFYFKIGACRHGNRCSRMHVRPNFSQTVLIPHLYNPPHGNLVTGPSGLSEVGSPEDQQFYFDFTDDLLDELNKFGRVEELHVCQNLGDHMFGNVYVKFRDEEEAERALAGVIGRCYAGQLIQAEYSPVTDFREARCRQYDEETCARGGYCNFMHLKAVPPHLKGYLRSATRGRGGGGRDDFKRAPPAYHREEHDRRGRVDHRRDNGGYDRRDDYRDRRDRDDRDRRGRDRNPRGSRDDYRDAPRRDNSAERRRQIAEWNREREVQQ